MMGQRVRFGAVFPPRNLDDYANEVRLLDDLGFAMIGKGDSQALSLDPYVTLSVAAANTKRAMVGTLVTNPVTRHPAASAAAIASLQVLSHGRAFFGIGTGDSSVYNLGRGVRNATALPVANCWATAARILVCVEPRRVAISRASAALFVV